MFLNCFYSDSPVVLRVFETENANTELLLF